MSYNGYDGPHADLRELIERIDRSGQLLRVGGVDPHLELGTLIELIAHRGGEHGPAVLFDDLVGAKPGHRAFSGATNSAERLALTLGLPAPSHPLDVVRAYRDRMKTHKPIPPVTVDRGPVLENIHRDDEVDVTSLVAPFLHEKDGGRYIGTDDLVIMRDPDSGWVNLGTYRSQVHGPDRVGLWISPGKQGRQIREKYFARGEPCPVLISCGHDPLLFLASGNELRYGLSEYDYAGGHRGMPFEVVESELHGLPMPAAAELVLEGEMLPGDLAPEGPFGEFTGYYAGGRTDQPVVRIRRVYHRDDPIVTVASPIRPPSNFSYSKCVMKAGMIWDEVERAGLSGVQGVWCHEAGAARMFNVISIKQAFDGHAKQAGLLAASCQSGSYLGRFVVVVDDDIDPTNTFDVLWAMSTRCDPAEDIEIVRRAWSGPLDPRIPRGHALQSTSLARLSGRRGPLRRPCGMRRATAAALLNDENTARGAVFTAYRELDRGPSPCDRPWFEFGVRLVRGEGPPSSPSGSSRNNASQAGAKPSTNSPSPTQDEAARQVAWRLAGSAQVGLPSVMTW